MAAPKMTVKVFSALYDAFSGQLSQLPIKRDAFLNCVLRTEVDQLAQALDGKRLSPEANRYISRQLKNLGTTTVSIAVDEDIIANLHKIVEQSNTVRDAFINRLITFLRSSDKLLDSLELPKEDKGRVGRISYGSPPTSPIAILEAAFSNPLEVLHIAAKELYGTNLYLIPFQPQLDGFACYLEDSQVPGTEAYRKAQREIEKLGDSLAHFPL